MSAGNVIVPAAAVALVVYKIKSTILSFKEKGALSADKAMTLQELGVHKRLGFELLLHRHYIVEIDDKYYFDDKRFDETAEGKFYESIKEMFEDLKDKAENLNDKPKDLKENQ
ncbi:MAG: hypothetical protein FWC47_06555 [Oscillospiraceae bacterium]|nr:hypothetical protein [Oscillospiraceae bacterium]